MCCLLCKPYNGHIICHIPTSMTLIKWHTATGVWSSCSFFFFLRVYCAACLAKVNGVSEVGQWIWIVTEYKIVVMVQDSSL